MTHYDFIKNATIEEIAEVLYEYYQIGTVEECQKMKREVEQNRWIPCTEKLPKLGVDVEITTDVRDRAIGYYADGFWWDSTNGDRIDVIAWKEPSDPWEGEYKVKGRIVIEIEKIPKDCFSCVQVNEYGYCQWIDKYIDCCSKIGERYPTCPIEPWEGE